MLKMLNNSNSLTMSGPPHYVDLHVNPGESVTIQLYDGNETLLRGPATITMISQHAFPPIPMPVQVPAGHMVQQIVDENGTLRHIILSAVNNNGTSLLPQPPGPPPPPPLPASHATQSQQTSPHHHQQQQQPYPYCCCCCYFTTPTPLPAPFPPAPPPPGTAAVANIHASLLQFPNTANIRKRLPPRNLSHKRATGAATNNLNSASSTSNNTNGNGSSTNNSPFFSHHHHHHYNSFTNTKLSPSRAKSFNNTAEQVSKVFIPNLVNEPNFALKPKIELNKISTVVDYKYTNGENHRQTNYSKQQQYHQQYKKPLINGKLEPSKQSINGLTHSYNNNPAAKSTTQLATSADTTTTTTLSLSLFKLKSLSKKKDKLTDDELSDIRDKSPTPLTESSETVSINTEVSNTDQIEKATNENDFNSRSMERLDVNNSEFLIDNRSENLTGDVNINEADDESQYAKSEISEKVIETPTLLVNSLNIDINNSEDDNCNNNNNNENGDMSSNELSENDDDNQERKESNDYLSSINTCDENTHIEKPLLDSLSSNNDSENKCSNTNNDTNITTSNKNNEITIEDGDKKRKNKNISINNTVLLDEQEYFDNKTSKKENECDFDDNSNNADDLNDDDELEEDDDDVSNEENKSNFNNNNNNNKNDDYKANNDMNEENDEIKLNKSSPQRSPKHLLPQIQVWNLTYTALNANTVKLKWTTVTLSHNISSLSAQQQQQLQLANQQTQSRHYKVEMILNKSNDYDDNIKTTSSTVAARIVYQGSLNSCRVTHLNSQQQYSFRVRTVSDGFMLVSNILTITTPEQSLNKHKKSKQSAQSQHSHQQLLLQHHHQSQQNQHHHQLQSQRFQLSHENLDNYNDELKFVNKQDQRCAILILLSFTGLAVVVACLIQQLLTN